MKKPQPGTKTATKSSKPPEYELICSTEWVSAKEACFDYASLGMHDSPKIVQSGKSSTRNTLKRCGLPLVSNLPGVKHALANFKELEIPVTELAPETVLKFLSKNKSAIANVPSEVSKTKFQTAEAVQSVLWYVMSHVGKMDENAFESELNKLIGLPLMMSEDGMVKAFNKHVLFATTFSSLASSNSDKFLHRLLINDFTNRRSYKSAGFRDFTVRVLASMLPEEIDSDLYQKQNVQFHIDKDKYGKISLHVAQDPRMTLDYLQQFWKFVKGKPEKVALEDHLEPLDDWYLLPCRIGDQLVLTRIGDRKTFFKLEPDNSMGEVLGSLLIRQATYDWCPAESSALKTFYSSILSDISYTNASFILSALLECRITERKKFVEFSFRILDFFQNAICSNRSDIDIEDFLTLPIFKHFDGGYRPILDG